APVLLLTALYLKWTRAGAVLRKRAVVTLPTGIEGPWRTYELCTFAADASGQVACATWRGMLTQFLPGLVNVARGHLDLVGLPPRTSAEVEALPPEWRGFYLRSRAGLIHDASFFRDGALTMEERYAMEGYAGATAGWRHEPGLLLRYVVVSTLGFL